jgi:hypothetical protein
MNEGTEAHGIEGLSTAQRAALRFVASLNTLMMALSLIGLLANRDLPSAEHCLRKHPKGKK